MADIISRLLLNTNDFNANMSRAQKDVKSMDASFTSVGKTAVAGFGAIAGAVGVAYGGVELFNKVMNSSNEMTDKWEAVCRSARSSVDEFFYSLSSGDFTFFNSGLDDIITKAQLAAGSIDQLGNTTMSYGYFNVKNQADFAEAITTIKDKDASPTDKSAAIATANSIMGDQRDITAQLRRRVTETMQALVTESNSLKAGTVSLFDVEKVIRLDVSAMGDEQKAKLKQQYAEYAQIAKENRSKYSKAVYSNAPDGGIIGSTVDMKAFDAAMTPINAKYQDAILYNTILVKKSDEWLQELLNIIGAADNAERSVAGMEKTLNRARQSKSADGSKPTKTPAQIGSLDYLEEQIKKAQMSVNTATTDDARKTAQKNLDDLSAQKLEMTAALQIDAGPAEGSFDYIEAKIKKLQGEFNKATTSEARAKINGEIVALNGQKDQINTEFNPGPAEGSLDFLDKQIAQARTAMGSATSDAARAEAQKTIDALENRKIILTIEAEFGPIADMSMAQKVELNVPTPEVEKYRKKLTEAQKAQDAMQQSMTNTSTGIGAIAQVMSNVSHATGEDARQWLTWGGNLLTAVGAAIPAIAALTVAKKAEATANAAAAGTGAASSMASIPIVGPILAVAAVASVIAAMAAIPKFANGGIVGGSSYFGDKVLAAVNSGEMILNTRQQKNLAGLIAQPRQQVQVSGSFRIRGRDMYALLKQEERFQSR